MDHNESADDHAKKLREIDVALPLSVPQEVRNVLHPSPLHGEDRFKFRCYPGISCFNSCCHNIEILLTPYDILRLRHRLNLSSEEFLHQYARPGMLPKGELPVAYMRMDDETGRCPFNAPEGCQVYADRPVTCRYYPIGLALMRREEETTQDSFYFLIKEDFCQGHREENEWTVIDWRANQGSQEYDQANRKWMSLIVKRRSAGDMSRTSLQLSEVFYMASTSVETMRQYVFDSTFLQRYEVPDDIADKIRQDDLELTHFAMDWLKSVLFGDAFFPVRAEAKRHLQEKAPATLANSPAPIPDMDTDGEDPW